MRSSRCQRKSDVTTECQDSASKSDEDNKEVGCADEMAAGNPSPAPEGVPQKVAGDAEVAAELHVKPEDEGQKI